MIPLSDAVDTKAKDFRKPARAFSVDPFNLIFIRRRPRPSPPPNFSMMSPSRKSAGEKASQPAAGADNAPPCGLGSRTARCQSAAGPAPRQRQRPPAFIKPSARGPSVNPAIALTDARGETRHLSATVTETRWGGGETLASTGPGVPALPRPTLGDVHLPTPTRAAPHPGNTELNGGSLKRTVRARALNHSGAVLREKAAVKARYQTHPSSQCQIPPPLQNPTFTKLP